MTEDDKVAGSIPAFSLTNNASKKSSTLCDTRPDYRGFRQRRGREEGPMCWGQDHEIVAGQRKWKGSTTFPIFALGSLQ